MTDWRADLDDFFDRQEQLERAEAERQTLDFLEVEAFIQEIVIPAFNQLELYLEQHGREVTIASGEGQATITVIYEGSPEILYRLYAVTPQPAAEYAYISKETGKAVKSSDAITTVEGPIPFEEITQELIIQHFIRKYKSVVA